MLRQLGKSLLRPQRQFMATRAFAAAADPQAAMLDQLKSSIPKIGGGFDEKTNDELFAFLDEHVSDASGKTELLAFKKAFADTDAHLDQLQVKTPEGDFDEKRCEAAQAGAKHEDSHAEVSKLWAELIQGNSTAIAEHTAEMTQLDGEIAKIDGEQAKLDDYKTSLGALSVEEYLEKNPEVKAKVDQEIRDGDWLV